MVRTNPIVFVALLLALLSQAPVRAVSPEHEFFETKIRPILAENCYRCLGEDGNSGQSLLVEAV